MQCKLKIAQVALSTFEFSPYIWTRFCWVKSCANEEKCKQWHQQKFAHNEFKLTVSVCLLPLVSPYPLSLPLALFLLFPLLAPDHLASPGDLFYQANLGYLKPSTKMLQTKVKDERDTPHVDHKTAKPTAGLSKVARCRWKSRSTWLVLAGYSARHFFTDGVF